MFTNISWTNYFILITLVLIAYYIIIGIRFYSHDLKSLLLGGEKIRLGRAQSISIIQKSNNDIDDANATTETFQAENPFAKTTEETFLEVEQLIIRLKEAIADGSDKKYIKQEFVLYLQLVLKEFPTLKYSQFQSAINELIISECSKYDSVTLSEDEVATLWNEVA